ncbi:MAG: hypothetical protein HC807_07185 [Gammaproteobacteria bacterium]|nr:hypothetical protein [Gammaproteobacteria bacterium]
MPADVRQSLLLARTEERAGGRGVHELAADCPCGETAPVALGRVECDRQAGGRKYHVRFQHLGEVLGSGSLFGKQQVEGDGARPVLREIPRGVGKHVVGIGPRTVLARKTLDRRLVRVEYHDRVEVDGPREHAPGGRR